MKLIADSGSTKTIWALTSKSGCETVKYISTAGINPFYQTEEEIKNSIKEKLIAEIYGTNIEEIYFYGAGCANEEKNNIVRSALSAFFPNATIEIASDILGAARALCGKERGIACIMGTGSNSCLYDGKNIIQNVSAGGFILGDEGSGAVLGRKLASDYIKGILDKELSTAFKKIFEVTPSQIINNVYRQPFPNRYLAGFAKFINEHIEHPDMYSLVYDSFTEFYLRNISRYEKYESLPIGFIGSVAFHFKEILQQVSIDRQFRISKILKTPIDELITFHE